MTSCLLNITSALLCSTNHSATAPPAGQTGRLIKTDYSNKFIVIVIIAISSKGRVDSHDLMHITI